MKSLSIPTCWVISRIHGSCSNPKIQRECPDPKTLPGSASSVFATPVANPVDALRDMPVARWIALVAEERSLFNHPRLRARRKGL
jgi:hypothetical protein